MDVKMKDSDFYRQVYNHVRTANRAIWELITELHDSDKHTPELKEKLIEISGDICLDILIPLEKRYDFIDDENDE